MTGRLSPELVRAAAAAWRWTPYGALTVTSADAELAVSGTAARVQRADPPADASRTGFVARVRRLARRHGATSLTWAVTDHGEPAGLDATLIAAGSTVVEDLTVLARPLEPGPVPDPGPPPVRRVDTVELLDAAYALESAVLGTPARSPRLRELAAAALAAQVAAGPERTGYRFVAMAGATVAGTAGLTLAGSVARLWGAAVWPAHRGRGLYQALLVARLRQAVAAGATLALAKARPDSSAPILRRYGFEAHDRERRHLLQT